MFASLYFPSVLLLLSLAQVEVRGYPPGDTVTQGFRDVTSPDVSNGKDYRYSGEGDYIPVNKARKARRRVKLEELDLDFIDSDDSNEVYYDFPTSDDDQSETTLEKPPTDRPKRETDEGLQGYRSHLLEQLNEYRSEKGLTQFQVDEELESGAQAWATAESQVFAMSHSCEECYDFTEVIARRRSSKPLPVGSEMADWAYKTLFSDDEDRTYAAITDDPDIHTVGFGIEFSREPRDKTYHAYVVLRFART